MQSFTLKDLMTWKEDVGDILIGLNICVLNLKCVFNPTKGFQVDIKHLNFLEYYIKQQKFILVIELSKILSAKKGDKRSFQKLFNRLQNQNYDSELNDYISNTTIFRPKLNSKDEIKIFALDLEIRLKEKKELIDKVINIRDKLFAHRDTIEHEVILPLTEIEELVVFATEIYTRINYSFFLSQKVIYSEFSTWSIEDVIPLLAKG